MLLEMCARTKCSSELACHMQHCHWDTLLKNALTMSPVTFLCEEALLFISCKISIMSPLNNFRCLFLAPFCHCSLYHWASDNMAYQIIHIINCWQVNIPAAYLSANMEWSEQQEILRELCSDNCRYKLLYVTPEKVAKWVLVIWYHFTVSWWWQCLCISPATENWAIKLSFLLEHCDSLKTKITIHWERILFFPLPKNWLVSKAYAYYTA